MNIGDLVTYNSLLKLSDRSGYEEEQEYIGLITSLGNSETGSPVHILWSDGYHGWYSPTEVEAL